MTNGPTQTRTEIIVLRRTRSIPLSYRASSTVNRIDNLSFWLRHYCEEVVVNAAEAGVTTGVLGCSLASEPETPWRWKQTAHQVRHTVANKGLLNDGAARRVLKAPTPRLNRGRSH